MKDSIKRNAHNEHDAGFISTDWKPVLSSTVTHMQIGREEPLFGTHKDEIVDLLQSKGIKFQSNAKDGQILSSLLENLAYTTIDNQTEQFVIKSFDVLWNSASLGDHLRSQKPPVDLGILYVPHTNSPEADLVGTVGSVATRLYLNNQMRSDPPSPMSEELLRDAIAHGNNVVIALADKLDITIPTGDFAAVMKSDTDDGTLDVRTVTIGQWVGGDIENYGDKDVTITMVLKEFTHFGAQILTRKNIDSPANIDISRWNTSKNADGIFLYGGNWTNMPDNEKLPNGVLAVMEQALLTKSTLNEAIQGMAGEHTNLIYVGHAHETKADMPAVIALEERAHVEAVRVASAELPLPVVEAKPVPEKPQEFHLLIKDENETVPGTTEIIGRSINGGRPDNEDALFTPNEIHLPVGLEQLVEVLNKLPNRTGSQEYTPDHVTKIFEATKKLIEMKKLNGMTIVADGMGGHSHGEMASSLAVFAATEYAVQHLNLMTPPTGNEMKNIVDGAINQANEMIERYNKVLNFKSGMTFAIALEDASGVTHYNAVGDTRIYMQDASDHVVLLSRDKSGLWNNISNQQNAKGKPSILFNYAYPEVFHMPFTQEKSKLLPSVQSITLKNGDRLMLCCDGCWDDIPKDIKDDSSPYMKKIDQEFEKDIKRMSREEALLKACGVVFAQQNLKLEPGLRVAGIDLARLGKGKNRKTAREVLDQLVPANAGDNSHDNVSVAIMEKH